MSGSHCGDPTHPSLAALQSLFASSDSVFTGNPGRPLPERIDVRALDGDGNLIVGAAVTWTTTGVGARVDSASAVTDAIGVCRAAWVMGTNAAEEQTLTVSVAKGASSITMKFRATLVATEVASFVAPETLTVKLGAPSPLPVRALDPYGNVVASPGMSFKSLDSSIAAIDTSGVVAGRTRGWGRIQLKAQTVTDTLTVHVIQIVQAVVVSPDTVRFNALGATQAVEVKLIDDLGQSVADSVASVVSGDSTVVAAKGGVNPFTLQSRGNGAALVRVSAGSVQSLVSVVVGQRVVSLTVTPDTSAVRLGLSDTLRATARDSLGAVVATPGTTYACLDTAVATVDSAGVVRGRARGLARIVVRAQLVTDTVRIQVIQVVQAIQLATDTLRFSALGALQGIPVTLLDDQGQVVADSVPTVAGADTGIVSVQPAALTVQSRNNGITSMTLSVGGLQRKLGIVVAQRATRLVVTRQALGFHYIGQSLTVLATAYDSLGSPLAASVTGLAVSDTMVATVVGDSAVRSRQNGLTRATFTVAGLAGDVAVDVSQVAASVSVTVSSPNVVLSLPIGASVPTSCQALDSNSVPLASPPTVATSGTGAVSGSSCAALHVVHSGVDTLSVSSGQALKVVPIAVAVPPSVSPVLADSLLMDSIPSGLSSGIIEPDTAMHPTVVSLRRNSRGQLEAYVSLMDYPVGFEDSYRYVSDDAVHFRYDGVVLRHDSTAANKCSPLGFGIEHVAIVPRADGVGWRMFFAGGSFTCYGWQVFSAVSSDEKTWTIENGVRVSNGAPFPPAAPTRSAPWPVGEGIVVDQMQNGMWRMVVGGYDQNSTDKKFQIVEWRSTDQLNWSYVGPLLRTYDLPSLAEASIYSPSIQEFAPGMWRMVFVGDNRDQPGGRYRIWSAVSTDREHWQVEGILMGQNSGNFYYVAVVDQTLVAMRDVSDATPTKNGLGRYVAMATITMP